ncbi:ABC transporter permease [Streptomyces sp. NPDC101227]|uniref:ABC transporter permease n=1 Tax=Streptomyces sp. NPDC101227 TaxID=3366136 RepID=UPI003802D003
MSTGTHSTATRPARSRSATLAVFRTEALLFRREPGTLFWVGLFPSVLLAILGLVPSFREAQPELGGRRTIDLYVPVTLLVAMIMAGLQALPPLLTGYRERGILRRMSTTPVRPGALLGSGIALHGAAALISAALALAVGRLAFGVELPRQLLGYTLALVLTLGSALALGCVICSVARTARIAQVIGSAVFFPMMFSAGVWAPVQAMPETLQHIVQVLPFGAGAQALGQAAAGDWPGWSHLAVMAAWTAVAGWCAKRFFRWE